MKNRLFAAKAEDPAELVRAWFRESATAAHGGFDEWHVPAVDAIAEAVVGRVDAAAPARRLGEQRAESGMGIAEGLSNLELLYRLHSRAQPPHAVSLAFSDGWADTELGTLLGRSSIDALTGLVTLDYLFARLAELYCEDTPITDRCLVVVDPDVRRSIGSARLTRTVGLAAIVRSIFSTGETTGILPGRVFVAIAHRGTALDEHLRQHIERTHGFDDAGPLPRIWVEPLPPTQELARQLLLSLDAA